MPNNTMITIKNMSIGVDSYCFSLKKNCAIMPKNFGEICISLTLSGNFFLAAKSDQITDTVDYEALCHHIEVSLSGLNCSSFECMGQRIEAVISRFSPLITGGYFSFTLRCHDTFTFERALDIDQMCDNTQV